MKKLLLMLALPAFFALSVNAGNVKVKVKIANPYGKVINIQVANKTYALNMDAQGVGSVDVDVKGETFATFSYPRVMNADIYLIEGKDIEVSFDLKKRGSDLAVKCDDKGVNSYLFELMKAPSISRNDFSLEEGEFINKVDNIIKNRVKDLDSKPFSKKFKKLQQENITYSIAANLAKYPGYYAWASGNKDYKPSAKYYGKVESLAKEQSKLVVLSSYKNFLTDALKSLGSKGQNVSSAAMEATLASKLAAKLKNQSLKDELIYNYANGVISRSGIDGADELLKLFKANVKDEMKVKAINDLATKWAKLAKGQPSPKFNYKDINGKMVSLDDLKGKYVYIDCWATWCGPCCGEIPHLKKLEHDYSSKNIHFVSISCDQNAKAWEAKVKKEQLGGIQLIQGKDRGFMNAYMVSGIPRFILIDKNGNIVKAEAPRPSSKEIREIFNGLKGL